MKLEQQVCSLELAQKLKDLGVKQDGFFSWVSKWKLGEDMKTYDSGKRLVMEDVFTNDNDNRKIASAFTVAELGEMLPRLVTNKDGYHNLEMDKLGVYLPSRPKPVYSVGYHTTFKSPLHRIEDVSESDARAKMLIYLLENKLITL